MTHIYTAFAFAIYVVIAVYQGILWWSLLPQREEVTDIDDPLFNAGGKVIVFAVFWVIVYVIAIILGATNGLTKVVTTLFFIEDTKNEHN